MKTKMLSASGANNFRDMVRRENDNIAQRKQVPSGVASSRRRPDDKENNINMTIESSGMSKLRKRRSISRPRLYVKNGVDNIKQRSSSGVDNIKQRSKTGVDNMKQRGRSGVDNIKQRSRNGADNIKQRSRTGVHNIKERGLNGMNSMKERGRNGVDNVKRRSKSVPRPLPSRSLFRHKPRTWFGTKQNDQSKVKEVDWRNTRPAAAKPSRKKKLVEYQGKEYKRSTTIDTGGSGSNSSDCSSTTVNTGASAKSSLYHHPQVGRSCSAPTRSSKVLYSEEFDWRQYLVEERDGSFSAGKNVYDHSRGEFYY